MINLTRNEGFRWNKYKNVYSKGYIFDRGICLKDNELSQFISENINNQNMQNFFYNLNGCFSCVIENENDIFLVSDKIASFPLFYSDDGKNITDNLEDVEGKNVDYDKVVELEASSYIKKTDTALKNYKIVDLGQMVKIEKSRIEEYYYYKHESKGSGKYNYEDFVEKYKVINNKIFDDLIKSLQGKTAIVPLSGGYDSRYIICMLKKKNYNNVICYTYGNEETYEVQYSKRIAEKLGYSWYFIEYNKEKWEKMFDDNFFNYCEYEHNYISVPHVQDYIALTELKKKGLINENAVIINGFCGDLPAGSFLLKKEDEDKISKDLNWMTEYIFKENYSHIKVNIKQKKKIIEKIYKEISSYEIKLNTINDVSNIYEMWFTGARPCKWVVNSNRLYEFLGLEWRMPLWDNRFIDFFYNLPYSEREDCSFYKKFLFTQLFEIYNVDMKKPEFTAKKTIKYNYSIKKKIKMKILYAINIVRIITGKRIVVKNDLNQYLDLALILTKKVKNKRRINIRNLNAHQMMAIWWCEYKYKCKK